MSLKDELESDLRACGPCWKFDLDPKDPEGFLTGMEEDMTLFR